MSVHEYIERRIPGGHRSPLGLLLDVAYVIEYGADSTEQSALNLVFLLGFQPAANSLSIFGESDEKFHIRGGNQQLPEAMARYLGGDLVKTGQRLARIKETANGRYKVTFERAGGSTDVVADFVVLALPFAVPERARYFRGGLRRPQAPGDRRTGPRSQRQAASSVRPARLARCRVRGPACPTARAMRTPATRSAGKRRAPKAAIRVSWSSTRADRPTDAAVTNQAFANAGNGGVRADAAIAQSQIASVYPGLSWNGKATQSLPHKSPLFRASYSFYKVGQYTAFGGYERSAAGRRAVLRRAHLDRLPGVHGRRGVRGPARRQAAREDARQRLTAAAPDVFLAPQPLSHGHANLLF